jgi:hypothetical protein
MQLVGLYVLALTGLSCTPEAASRLKSEELWDRRSEISKDVSFHKFKVLFYCILTLYDSGVAIWVTAE